MGAGLWTPAHAALADHFRVLLPDHPGFGACPLPEWLDGMEDLVFHYLDLLDAEGLTAPVDVVGASFGGWIAAELACRHPERVRRMILIDAAGLRLADHPVPDVFRLPPQDVVPLLFHDVTKALVYLPPDLSPDTLVRMFHDRTALARLAWNPYLHDPKLPPRLYRARIPCLILWGREDRFLPPPYAEAYRRLLPDARIVWIDDCGHDPLVEQPTPTAEHIRRFLQE
jgi:pimeloyl-ACP methyl ester carboxylesterase